MAEKVWKWNQKLSWELFSDAVYNYRQIINESRKHKIHNHCKNGIFAAITSLEAFLNETLIIEHQWSKNQLQNNTSFEKKLIILIKDFSIKEKYFEQFKKCKQIRNNYLVHHKENDHSYSDKINSNILLETIESVQEIISRVCFNNPKISYPYWLSGLNFLNPSSNHDITLINDYEYWLHIGQSVIDHKNLLQVDQINYNFEYPKDWESYIYLYKYIWDVLKQYNFNIEIEQRNTDRFPFMPYFVNTHTLGHPDASHLAS